MSTTESDWDSTIVSRTQARTTLSWVLGFDHSHAEWLLSPAGSVFWQSSQSSVCHPCSRQCFPGQYLKSPRERRIVTYRTQSFSLLPWLAVMSSLEEQLPDSEHTAKARGDILISAINCGRLGIRTNFKHFNWMSSQIQNCDPRTAYFSGLPLFHQNVPWHPLLTGTSWRSYNSKEMFLYDVSLSCWVLQLPQENIKSLKQCGRTELWQTCCFSEVLKELLVEDEGHAADLLNLCLRWRVPVDEVRSDGNGKLAPELLTPKPWGKITRGWGNRVWNHWAQTWTVTP